MASGGDETGTRYDVALDAQLPSLAGVPRVARVTGPTTYDVEATFVDTPELALTLAGVTLRRRTGGPDEGWRLGLPTARGRFEVPAPLDESGDAAPESLRSAVALFLRGGELEPLAVVRARTAVHEVLDSRGRVLAEVRDEHITAQTTAVLGEEPAPRAWRAWEIRLVGGDLDVLSAVAGLMEDAGATPAPSGSTLRRALGDRTRGRSAPLEVGTDSSAHEVVRAHLVRLVRELRTLDPLVRVDAPDAVHQMRVLARRLRSTLATYRPLLDAEVTDPMREELRWVAGVLGDARDAEVLRRRLLRQLDEEPPELVRGTIRTFVDRDLEERYREDHDALRRGAEQRALPGAGRAADGGVRVATLGAGDGRRRVRACCTTACATPTSGYAAGSTPCPAPTTSRTTRGGCTRCARRPSGCATRWSRWCRWRASRPPGSRST